MTQFVEMYHPLIPDTSTSPREVAVQAVDDFAARGWLLFDPDAVLPDPATPYYTKEALLSQITGGASPIGTALRAALVPRSQAPVNVMDPAYGAKGDGTTDDTAAIQAALNAAAAANRDVYFPAGAYKITASLKLKRRGMRIFGSSSWYCTLTQATASAHGLELQDDPIADAVQGPNNLYSVRVEGLRLIGAGAATSTGSGIFGAYKAGQYNGDFLQCSDVSVYGFGIGVYLDHWAQTSFRDCVIHYNGVGLQLSATGNTNTIRLDNTAIARNTTVGFDVGVGRGITVNGGDWVGQPKSILVRANAQVTMLGGNFESPSAGATDAVIDVQTTGQYVGIGQGFLRSAGADIPIYRVDQNASLTIIAPQNNGFTTLIKKLASTAVVHVLGSDTSLSNSPVISENGTTTYRPGVFAQRVDNAVPAATAGLRALTLLAMARDTANVQDYLYHYVRDQRSGTASYSRRTLSAVITGTGSPEGVATAGPGVMYLNESGGAGTTLYVKETGTGNTGWAAK